MTSVDLCTLPKITLSIVSHGQCHLVNNLISDLNRLNINSIELIITLNHGESPDDFVKTIYPVKFIINKMPFGFGKNHNNAFVYAKGAYFAAVNPDIRIFEFDLDALLHPFSNPNIANLAPLVFDPHGFIEDSARRFPNFFTLVTRKFLGQQKPDYEIQSLPFEVDWVGGMFVVFKSSVFDEIGGFDSDRYFMYFEDVDICRTLHSRKYITLVNPSVSIIHDAQRKSRTNLQYFIWHLSSALKYFVKWAFR